MNLKVTLLLLVVIFAPVVATATVSGVNTPKLDSNTLLETTALRIVFKPDGDPLDSPIGPH